MSLFSLHPTMEACFLDFHRENPHVYAKLLEIARFLRDDRHLDRIGIAFLFERLRWVSLITTTGDPYRLNNNFRAFYARRLMQEPGLDGLFETRSSVADA